jgi:CRISPR-associated protein Csd1
MILKALYDYYQRCDGLAPAGMENKEIAFVVVIDKEGNFKRFEDHRQEKDRCDQFLVAKGIGRTSKPIANLFWDNSAYSFGYSDADEREMKLMEKDPDSLTPKEVSDLHEGIPKEKAKNQTCFLCFKEKVEKVATVLGNNLSANSLSLFYKNRTSKDIIKLFKFRKLYKCKIKV